MRQPDGCERCRAQARARRLVSSATRVHTARQNRRLGRWLTRARERDARPCTLAGRGVAARATHNTGARTPSIRRSTMRWRNTATHVHVHAQRAHASRWRYGCDSLRLTRPGARWHALHTVAKLLRTPLWGDCETRARAIQLYADCLLSEADWRLRAVTAQRSNGNARPAVDHGAVNDRLGAVTWSDPLLGPFPSHYPPPDVPADVPPATDAHASIGTADPT